MRLLYISCIIVGQRGARRHPVGQVSDPVPAVAKQSLQSREVKEEARCLRRAAAAPRDVFIAGQGIMMKRRYDTCAMNISLFFCRDMGNMMEYVISNMIHYMRVWLSYNQGQHTPNLLF